jgi:hypothetical protein
MNSRNRTSSELICYDLYLYFSGLSLRRTSRRLSYFIKRNHVPIWNWIQKYNPQNISSKRKKIAEYIMDETKIKFGSEYVWLWVLSSHIIKKFFDLMCQRSEICLLQRSLSWFRQNKNIIEERPMTSPSYVNPSISIILSR